MMNLKDYMNDDACWAARAVLAFLQGNTYQITEDKYFNHNIDLLVGRYENCREQGYVFTIKFWGIKDGRHQHIQRNYAVYQHRNSDTICVLISNASTINTPGIDEMWKEKGENPRSSQYDQGFDWDDIKGCANYIINDMMETLEKYSEEDHN